MIKIKSWGWIGVGVETPLASLVLITVAACLFYCTYISYLGLRSSNEFTEQNIRRGLFFAKIAFVIVILLGLIFTVNMLIEDPTDWWLDTSFYGGFLGSGLTAIFFHLTIKSNRK